ncbi:MAG TPA: hypothetical protein VGR16_07675, partial [Thermomicrobiales bacterium]|nr:hypothetical protein [Thermomicrobiales bacterium]
MYVHLGREFAANVGGETMMLSTPSTMNRQAVRNALRLTTLIILVAVSATAPWRAGGSAAAGGSVTLAAQVALCDNPARAGSTTYILDPVVGIDYSGCRPASSGEVTIDLYASPTAEEDPGSLVASAETDASGIVSFTYDFDQPYVYFGQGEPGSGGRFSEDIAVAAVDQESFLILNHVAGNGVSDETLVPTADTGIVEVSAFVCQDQGRAGTEQVMIDDPLARDLDTPGCRPAVEGELEIDLFASPSPSPSDMAELVASDTTTARGELALRYDLTKPFVSVRTGAASSPEISISGGQRVGFYAVRYVEDLALAGMAVTINAQRIVCQDTTRAGSVLFVQDGSTADVPYADCRPANAGEATISLY